MRRALIESEGDVDRAVEFLREKGLASVAKRAGRTANQGLVDAYVHFNNTVGVLVEVNCETDFVAKTDDFQSLVKDIAMHIAASSPLYVTKEEVPAAILEKEKEIYKAQAAGAGKPAGVQDEIAEGRLKDYYTQFCLLEQPFVKEPKLTIAQLVEEKSAVLKENIVVRRFSRFRVGEEVAGEAKKS